MPSLLKPLLIPVLFSSCVLIGCGDPSPSGRARVTFIVTADSVPSGGAIHLAGSTPELGPWNPDGLHLTRGGDGAWTGTLELPAGERFEYKFTRGTWWTEGVGEDGLERPNFVLLVRADTTVRHRIPLWRDMSGGPVLVSVDRLLNKGGTIELYDRWRFRAGDSAHWAAPGYDDRSWTTAPSLVRPADPWPPERTGPGWFRLRLSVDSTLRRTPLAWTMTQSGASDVYLNGRLIARLGTVGTSAEDERPYEDRTPRILFFDEREEQVIAVRYSDFSAERLRRLGTTAGFILYLSPADGSIEGQIARTRAYASLQVLLITLAAFLAILHLFMFFFDRSERGNLAFSILMGGMALLAFADLESFFATSRSQSVLLARLSVVGALALSISGLGTIYVQARRRLPAQFYALLAAGAVVVVALFSFPGPFANIGYTLVVGIVALDILRVVLLGILSELRPTAGRLSGGWILGLGATVFVIGVLYQILANFGLVPLFIAGFPPFYVGFVLFAATISLHLAYRNGAVNRELARQLEQVRSLSERTIEQERLAHEEELSRRVLEADNARKTRELEEARKVQLAMLPSHLPRVPGLSIAVRMTTATEVGGDYYDFRQDNDGSLTLAVGDATGHGTKAGIMVTLIKSLFNVSGHSFYIPDFFQHCTSAIRRMNLEQLYMGLQLARFKGRRLTASSAGMPPFYVYRAGTGAVDEVVLKGMPLGANVGFPYQQTSIDLHDGDTLLFLSDGFPERFNAESEILGYARVKEIFGECAMREPDAVIDHMTTAADRWSGGAPLNDDMTFVVVKVGLERVPAPGGAALDSDPLKR